MLLLTSCWNKRELDEMSIVYGVAIEKSKDNQNIEATFQVVNPNQLREKGGGETAPIQIITSEGKTVFDAIRNNIYQFDRKAFFYTNKVIVIDEELAKEGLIKILDILKRDQETMDTSKIVIAKGVSAREVLGIKIGIENIQGSYFEDIINNSIKHNTKSTVIDVLSFCKKCISNGINPIAGVVETIEQTNLPEVKAKGKTSKGIKYLGTAVFKEDRLVGFFDGFETRGLNWATRVIKDTIITFPLSEKKEALVTVEINNSKAKISPLIKNDSLFFNIDIKVEGKIGETTVPMDFSDTLILEKIKKVMNDEIEKEVKHSIKKAQKEFKSDVFGFGLALRRKHPDVWKIYKKDWDKEFSYVKYKVNVESKLKDSGLLFKKVK
jgi:spore germination protein KC